MRYIYPCILTPDEEGWLTATFPDVPEAGTSGKTPRETLALAEDALAVALGGYIQQGRNIPVPGLPGKGQYTVAPPPLAAAKLALYAAMRGRGMTKVALAARLGVSEAAVRKLIDPDHRSHIGGVETALKALGRTLVVEDRAA